MISNQERYGNMEDLIKKIEVIKDNIYETYSKGSFNNDTEQLSILMRKDEISPAVKESLILLHSGYRAEFQGIRNYQLTSLGKLADLQGITLRKLSHEIEMINSKLPPAKKPFYKRWLPVSLIVTSVTVLFIIIWILAYIDLEASEFTFKFLKELKKLFS